MAGMAEVLSRPRKTVEDYLALPDDVLAELIDGELYVTPAPTPNHQDVVGALHVHLRTHVEREELGRVYVAPVDVYLPTGDIVQPDLVFVRADRQHVIQDAIRGVPDVAVEVISPSRPERDRIVKRALFARNGIQEFWLVDPAARSVEVFVLREGAYVGAGWFREKAVVVSPALPGLEIPLETVFRADPAP
jgi:Uma2 family endonuclease